MVARSLERPDTAKKLVDKSQHFWYKRDMNYTKLPVLSTHFSFGRSILTTDMPKSEPDEYSDSVFDVAKYLGLDCIFVFDDNLAGFKKLFENAKKQNIKLVFGVLFKMKDSLGESEVILFARSDEGYKELSKVYSSVHTEDGYLKGSKLSEISSHIAIFFPFYNSFLAKNSLTFNTCAPNIPKDRDIYFMIEDHELPFDQVIEKSVKSFCSHSENFVAVESHLIYYKMKDDILALMTYKLDTNRKFSKSAPSLSSPNLDDFGSDSFSAEYFKEKHATIQ